MPFYTNMQNTLSFYFLYVHILYVCIYVYVCKNVYTRFFYISNAFFPLSLLANI